MRISRGNKKKRVIVSVSNDIFSDQRVHKVCSYLTDKGCDVLLIGRKLPNSKPLNERSYKTKRFKLLFKNGPLFYAELNTRFFLFLLFKKADVLLANDLDTLLANYCANRFKKAKLVYDTHEYFTEVPELQNNKFAKRTWERIEKWIFPKLKYVYTVNQSIADIYHKKYGNNIKVVRNIPPLRNRVISSSREELQLPSDKFIIILQGAGINIDRGGEELVEAMKYLNNTYLLLIVGGGDALDTLKSISIKLKVENKIKFIDKQPYEKLIQYTVCANLGATLDKDTNLNYRFSLPNKLFDYIHSGIPVLSSNLVEISKIIKQYNIGILVDEVTPQEIAKAIEQLAKDSKKYLILKNNTNNASSELTWQSETKVLDGVYSFINN